MAACTGSLPRLICCQVSHRNIAITVLLSVGGDGAGALKTLGANKNAPLPVKLFEASDVVLLDELAETGARNERRLVAVACAKEGSFEVIHGLLNRVMDVLDVPLLGARAASTCRKYPCAARDSTLTSSFCMRKLHGAHAWMEVPEKYQLRAVCEQSFPWAQQTSLSSWLCKELHLG